MKKLIGSFLLAISLLFPFAVSAQLVQYTVSRGTGAVPGMNTDSDTLSRISTNGYTQILGSVSGIPQYSAVINLPFTFNFYNQSLSQFCVSPTGLLTFDISKAGQFVSPTNGSFTTNLIPNKSIAAFWGNFNLNTGTGSGASVSYKVFGSAPNRQFWVEWSKTRMGNATNLYFSLVLEEGSNHIYCVDRGLISGSYSNAAVGVKFDNNTYLEVVGSPSLSFFQGTASLNDNKWYKFNRFNLPLSQITIGNTNTFSSSGTYPNPYCTLFNGSHHQFLYPSSLLQAMGANYLMTSLGFQIISQTQSTPLNGFTISLKNTPKTTLNNSFESGYTPVFYRNAINTSLGWNNYAFDRLFAWDTTQNLLVDICFNNTQNTANSLNDIALFGTNQTNCLVVAENNNQACGVPYGNALGMNASFFALPSLQIGSTYPFVDLLKPVVKYVSPLSDTCIPSARQVFAKVIDDKKLDSVWLYFSDSLNHPFDSVAMVPSGNQFMGTLPAPLAGQLQMVYAVQATDSAGNRSDRSPWYSYAIDRLTASFPTDTTVLPGTLLQFSPTISSGKVRGVKITEIISSRSSGSSPALQTYNPPWFPSVFTADNVIEIQNLSGYPVNISGYRLLLRSTTPSLTQTFVFPSGTNLNPGQIALVFSGNGAFDTARKIYNFNLPFGQAMFSGADYGIFLRDASGRTVDGVRMNQYVFSPADSGNNFIGSVNLSFQGSGLYRVSDKGDSTDWVAMDVGSTDSTSYGLPNPGLKGDKSQFIWKWLGNSTPPIIAPSFQFTAVQDSSLRIQFVNGGCVLEDTLRIHIQDYCRPTRLPAQCQLQEFKFDQLRDTLPIPSSGYLFVNNPAAPEFRQGATANRLRLRYQTTAGQPAWMGLFIDLNLDGDFADTGEKFFYQQIPSGYFGRTLALPANTPLGYNRLRLILSDSAFNTACDTLHAETRDYTLAVSPNPPDPNGPDLLSLSRYFPDCQTIAQPLVAQLSDLGTVDSVWAELSLNNLPTQRVLLQEDSLDNQIWRSQIPGVVAGDSLFYRILAKDDRGNLSTSQKYLRTYALFSADAGKDTAHSGLGSSTIVRVGKPTPGDLQITEVILNASGPGAQANFPAGIPKSNNVVVELTNLSNRSINYSGQVVYFEYTAPNGTVQAINLSLSNAPILAAGKSVFLSTNVTTNPSLHRYSIFGSNFVSGVQSGRPFIIALLDSNRKATDFIRFNDTAALRGRGVKNNRFIGSISSLNGNAFYRSNKANLRLASDWTSTGVLGDTSTMGNLNPGISIIPRQYSWWLLNGSSTVQVSNNDTLTDTLLQTKTYLFQIQSGACTATDTFVFYKDTLALDAKAMRLEIYPICENAPGGFVRAWVKNAGNTTLPLSNRPIQIQLSFQGGNFTGSSTQDSLKSGDSLYVDLPNFNFSTNQLASTFGVSGRLIFLGDVQPANDTFALVQYRREPIKITLPPSANVFIGDTLKLSPGVSHAKVLITELILNAGNPGSPTAYPGGIQASNGTPDMIEVQNHSPLPLSLNGLTLWVWKKNPAQFVGTFTITDPLAILPPDSVLTLVFGTGTNNPSAGVFYLGGTTANIGSMGDTLGFVLTKSGVAFDAVSLNAFKFNTSTQVDSYIWDGFGITASNTDAAVSRLDFGMGGRNHWRVNTLQAPCNPGIRNLGLRSPSGQVSWSVNGNVVSTSSALSYFTQTPGTAIFTVQVDSCLFTYPVQITITTNFTDLKLGEVSHNLSACERGGSKIFNIWVKNAGNMPFVANSSEFALVLQSAHHQFIAPFSLNLAVADSIQLSFFDNTFGPDLPWVRNLDFRIRIQSIKDARKFNDSSALVIVPFEPLVVDAGNDTISFSSTNVKLKAQSKAGKLLFSEIVFNRTKTGGQSAASYPTVANASQLPFIEISNPTTATIAADSLVFKLYRSGSGLLINYPFPTGVLLKPGETWLVCPGTGIDDLNERVVFAGLTGNLYQANAALGYVLESLNGHVHDVVAINGYSFQNAGAGYDTLDFSGSGPFVSNFAGAIRKGYDTNSSKDWKVSSLTDTTTLGRYNTGLDLLQGQISWLNAQGTVLSNRDTVQVSLPGQYIAKLEQGSCVAYDTVTVDFQVGTMPIKAEGLIVYPNPAREVLNIRSDHWGGQSVELMLWDAAGRRIKTHFATEGINNYSLSVGDLSPGVYLLECRSGNERSLVRWVKE